MVRCCTGGHTKISQRGRYTGKKPNVPLKYVRPMTHNEATRQVVENIGGKAIDTATEPRATRTAVLHHVYTSNAAVTAVAGEVLGDKSGSKTAQQLYAHKRRKARGDRSPTGGEEGSSTAACGVGCDKRALGCATCGLGLQTANPISQTLQLQASCSTHPAQQTGCWFFLSAATRKLVLPPGLPTLKAKPTYKKLWTRRHKIAVARDVQTHLSSQDAARHHLLSALI